MCALDDRLLDASATRRQLPSTAAFAPPPECELRMGRAFDFAHRPARQDEIGSCRKPRHQLFGARPGAWRRKAPLASLAVTDFGETGDITLDAVKDTP